MHKIITLIAFLLITSFAFSQVLVINELDCDTPSIDDKEFVEIKSATPNFDLDGYVVVFFNGSSSGGNTSYLTFDLDGYTTDVNGLLLIGSATVSPFPQYVISPNLIQNGPDAVAIYLGDDFDFEEGTLATQNNLIDALVYDTSDADVPTLMALLGVTEQINEGSANNTNSIQRNNDGTYFVSTPTPRQLNDGTGVVLNGILMALSQTMYNEGETFDIQFTTEQNVTSDLNFTIDLNYVTFDTSDYSGNISILIPSGQNSATTTITLIDDTLDEGDEEMLIRLSGLTSEYVSLNNNLRIRVVDNDFVVAPFGTPVNPTYGVVASTQPVGYYDSADGFAGGALKQSLQDIIAEEGFVRAQTYSDIIDILKAADQNPANSNQVWLVYTEQGRPKLDYQTTSNSVGKWNREHTFPRSRGGFNSIDLDDVADGPDVYWNTTADSLRHGNSDAHALRAADGPENSSRNNQHYGQYNGPAGTVGSFKGDVARSVLYMAIRFNGLSVVNGFPEGAVGQLGDLTTLLDWHRNDPPDDYEMNRNNVVYNWQYNRNPLIDHPNLVEFIWGTHVGDVWNQALSVDTVESLNVKIYPNPTSNKLYINGITDATDIVIFSIDGRQLLTYHIDGDSVINLNLSSGMYVMKLSSDGQAITKKIVVE